MDRRFLADASPEGDPGSLAAAFGIAVHARLRAGTAAMGFGRLTDCRVTLFLRRRRPRCLAPHFLDQVTGGPH